MALAANNKCFPPFLFHHGFPIRIAQLVKVRYDMDLIQIGLSTPTQLTNSGIEPLSDSGFPAKFLPLIDDVTRFATLAISDFNGAYTLSPCFGFIGDRPCFPVFVLTNDFADTGFMLVGNRLKATVLHEIAEVIQRMVITSQIVKVA